MVEDFSWWIQDPANTVQQQASKNLQLSMYFVTWTNWNQNILRPMVIRLDFMKTLRDWKYLNRIFFKDIQLKPAAHMSFPA
jgi:hypothetical protein